MLTEPQKGHLRDAAKGLADSLDDKQLRRLYFLVDDIRQYGCQPAAAVIHRTLNNIMDEKRQ